MSNPILASNQSSAVVATINESTTKNPWVYNETDRLVVPHAMQLLQIQPSSGSVAANATAVFDIPKNGICQQLFLNLKVSGTGLQDDNEADSTYNALHTGSNGDKLGSEHRGMSTLGFLDVIDSIRLSASGRTIEHLDRWQMLARYSELTTGKRSCVINALRMARTILGGATEVNDIPILLPFWFSSDQQRYGLLTNFEEPFRVEVKFRDTNVYADATIDGTNVTSSLKTLTFSAGSSLIAHYRQLDEPQMNEVVSKNYGDGLLSRVVNMSKRETERSFASADNMKIELKETEAVRALYVIVEVPRKKATIDDLPKLRMFDAPLPITEFELKFNNTSVIKCPGQLIKNYGRWGMGPDTADGSDGNILDERAKLQYVYKIDFGLGHGKGLENVVAFRELSNPTLTITSKIPAAGDMTTASPAAAVPSADHPVNVHVIYDTATFLSTSSSTGRVQLSISS